MKVYIYTNQDDAMKGIETINDFWGFCAPDMITCYNQSDVYWNDEYGIWYLHFSEYSAILGDPTEINIIN